MELHSGIEHELHSGIEHGTTQWNRAWNYTVEQSMELHSGTEHGTKQWKLHRAWSGTPLIVPFSPILHSEVHSPLIVCYFYIRTGE